MTQFNEPFGGTAGALEENYPFFNQLTTYESAQNTPFASVSSNNPFLPSSAPSGLYLPTTPKVINNAVPIPTNVFVKYMYANFRPGQEYDWNFGVEQMLTSTTAFTLSYIGTRGLHLYRTRLFNSIIPGGTFAYPLASIDPQLGDSIQSLQSDGYSIYNAMQAEVKQSLFHGLVGSISYTWSHEKDDLNTWDPYNNAVDTGGGADYMPNDIVGSVVYQLPFGSQGKWLANSSPLVNTLVGGWQWSSILNIQSGTPLIVYASYDALQTDGQIPDHANKTCPTVPQIGSVNEWFNTNCYSDPALDQIGTSGLDSARSPRYTNMDMSLAKMMAIGHGDRMHLELKLDAINALNHPHYGAPDTNLYDKLNTSGLGTYEFGTISGSVGIPRSVQLGVHLTF
jgi:hypothetical protein